MELKPYRDTKIVEMAREIAMEINELDEILRAYGVEPDEFEELKQDPFFQNTLDQFIAEWNSATNTERRVKFKAQASLELALENLHEAMISQSNPLNHRVLAMQFVAKLGGLGVEEKQQGPANGGFSITINMGDQPLVIEGNSNDQR